MRQRTEELTRSNQALQNEIAERGRLEREILQVSVREQQRIGQELHDGLGQELTGLSYLAQNLLLTLKAKGAPEVEMAGELAHGIPQVARADPEDCTRLGAAGNRSDVIWRSLSMC